MESDSLQVDKRRLGHAWSCVMPAFFQMCVEQTQKHDAGISVFRMLSQTERQDDESNCAFHYITQESPSWETAMIHAPNKDAIASQYDPTRHIIVAVHIPAIEGQDSTVGNVRLFENEVGADDQPVEIDIV